MAHEVETMAYYGQVPWHGLGTQVDNYMTSAEALVAAGLDWDVEQRPVFTITGATNARLNDETQSVDSLDVNEDVVQLEGSWMNTRVSDDKPLAVVGDVYTPVQNRDAFALMDAIVETKDAHYETAGSLFGGRRVWMLSKLSESIAIAGDVIDTYLFGENRHDGSGQFVLGTGNVRVVCANTMKAARHAATTTWKFRHSTNVHQAIEDARRAMGLVIKSREHFEQEANELLALKFPKQRFVKLTEALFPIEEEMTKLQTSNAQKRREKLLTILSDTPDLANIKSTGWGAYNAVVEFADHARRYNSAESRFVSIMGGASSAPAQIKEQALDLILATS